MNKIAKTLFYCFFYSANLIAIDIGSDTTPTRFNAQQPLLDGDRIAGFASMAGGFALNGLTTTAIFDSFFPVEGGVDFNAGSLILNRDLIMHNVSAFGPYGNIYGNGHAWELPCISQLPSLPANLFRCLTFLVDDNTAAAGAIFTVDWSFDDRYLAVGLGPGPADRLYVYDWNGTSLTLLDSHAPGGETSDINDIKWHPDKYLIAVVRDAGGVTDEVFTVSFDVAGSTLIDVDSAGIPANAMGCGWASSGNFLAVGSEDTAGQLRIYSVDSDGFLTLEVTEGLGTTQLASEETTDFNEDDRFVALGVTANGVDPTLYIYEFDSVTPALTLNSATVFTPNQTVEAFAWSRTNTFTLGLGFDGADYIRVYDHEPTVPSGGDPGSISFIAQSEPFNDKPEAISFSPVDEGCLVAGADGPPGEGTVRTFFFDREAGTIETISSFDFLDDCETARWSSTGRYLASGSDDGNQLLIFETVSIPSPDGIGTGPSRCYIFSDLKMILTCNLFLFDLCVTFTGICTIDGRGHCLELDTTCTMKVGANSSLCFNDIMVKGVNDNRVHGLDTTSTVSFKNVEWVLDGNFSFTMGRIDIIEDFFVLGEGQQFSYESDQVSTIYPDSRMIIGKDLTFRYNPSVASQTLFQLQDESSRMLLKSATFATSDVGWQATRGKVIVDGLSFFSNEGTLSTEAITFGDGTEANNACLKLMPAANLELLAGHLRWNNA